MLDARLRGGGQIDAVLDDDASKTGTSLAAYRIAGTRSVLKEDWARGAGVIPAVGHNGERAALIAWLFENDHEIISVIHPKAIVGDNVSVGPGTFMAAGAIVNADTVLENGAIINTLGSVDHDCHVGRSSHIGPGARLCGGVTVGSETLIGSGAIVVPGVHVGNKVVVGAGSIVIRDVPDGARVVGNPAHII